MRLEGIHHVTAITGDAPLNVDFYTRVLGLRLVAKTVNQDDPTVYHLFYADEDGSPGGDITFFEYPGAARGRAGAGMVHRVVWRVASAEAIDFWEERLAREGVAAERVGETLVLADPEGLAHELVVSGADESLIARHPDIPPEYALRGFDGVRAHSLRPDGSAALLERLLGARAVAEGEWELRGERRGGTIRFDAAPGERGRPGAGTVHHVAWGATVADHARWEERLEQAGVRTSGIIDRHYFRSIYFREPGGVLYEIADFGPGFTRDLPLEELGTKVILPPWLEDRRKDVEAILTPLPDPRAGWVTSPR
jgi:glyoxalase family protein